MRKKIYKKGIAILEVVIATSIISVGMMAFIGSYIVYMNYAIANEGNVQASYLAEEGVEVMGHIRDKGWTTNIAPLSSATTYYLVFSSVWTLTTTPQYIDGVFLRKIAVGSVNRDVGGQIVSSGGIVDANTRLVTVTLEYFQGRGTTTRSVSGYITNLKQD